MTVSSNSPTTHWNDLADGYDRIISKDRSYQEQLDQIVSEITGEPKRILDLGCGTGALLTRLRARFPNAELVGLDAAEEMLKIVKQKFDSPSVSCYWGSADCLEFADESFDYVVSNWALHHLPHDRKIECAKEVYRVLKPNGKFINGDQFVAVMGEIKDRDRVLHLLELLSQKARYYFEEVSFERMLLQVKLMPKFLTEDGECMATTDFWMKAMEEAGFMDCKVIVTEPAYLLNRIVVGCKREK